MFIPLHDENALKHVQFQFVTVILIAVNVAIFLVQESGMTICSLASFALVPAELVEIGAFSHPACSEADILPVPENVTLVSYMFLHCNWMNLIGNMLFLWVFGDNVEDAVGHFKFLIFFLLCGIGAGLLHTVMMTGSDRPLVGASGGVAGVIAAYLMLHPKVNVWVLAFRVFPLRISAMIALGLWIAMQFAMLLFPQAGPVAWWAHVGGLATGAILIIFMRRPGIPLFDRGLRTT